jgi:predicted nucleotidyltransferase
MVTQQAAISTAHEFVKECQAIGLTFNKVLLFGSYAKGSMHEGSDIDLLLISKKFTDDVFANLRQYANVNIRFPQVETHPYSYQQFMEGDEFLQQIIKEGVEIETSR